MTKYFLLFFKKIFFLSKIFQKYLFGTLFVLFKNANFQGTQNYNKKMNYANFFDIFFYYFFYSLEIPYCEYFTVLNIFFKNSLYFAFIIQFLFILSFLVFNF
jgi:hypothetical protein